MRGASLLSLGRHACWRIASRRWIPRPYPYERVSLATNKPPRRVARACLSTRACLSKERACGIGITGIDIGWLLKVLICRTRPAFAGFERDRLRRFGGDRKVAHRKAVALGEDFGDAAAVAHTPIGLVAQQTAGPGPGDLGACNRSSSA